MFKKTKNLREEFEALKRMLNFKGLDYDWYYMEPSKYKITLPDGTVISTLRHANHIESFDTKIEQSKKKRKK